MTKVLLSVWLGLCCALSASAQAPGAEPNSLLSNGDFLRGEETWELPGESATSAIFELPPNSGVPAIYRRALRLQVQPQPDQSPYSIAMRQSIGAKIGQNQPLVLRLWMRSPDKNRIGLYVEEKSAPHEKSLGEVVQLSPEWKEYEVRGQAKADFNFDDARLVFHLGWDKGTIEMTGLRLFDPTGQAQLPLKSNGAPDKPESLLENGDFSRELKGTWDWGDGDPVQATIVPAQIPGTAWKQALRLNVAPPVNSQPWNVQIGQKINKAIGRDEAVYARVWLRSPDRVRTAVVFEMGQAPNTKYINQPLKLTPEWKEYRFVGYPARPLAPGEAQLKLFLGYDKGSIEIAGFRLESYGRAPKSMFSQTIDYWGGVERDDSWRKPALERIEKIRKGDLKVLVTDAQGKPVPDAQVLIEQQKHFFRFGTAGPVSRILDGNSPDSLRYREVIKKWFNTFVFESDLKWPNSEQPKMLDRIDAGIDWLKANGIEHIRAHNLVWGSQQYLPTGVLDKTPDEINARIREHIRTTAGRTAGKVYVWDVVNEASNEMTLWDKIGWDKFAEVYKWTRETDPKVLLAYNDYHAFNDSNSPKYKTEMERIQYLIGHAAPFDIIGEQAHMGAPLVPMTEIVKRLDLLAKFTKRIEITEFDAGIADDTVHGEYVRDFLIACFSHPQVDAFLMWGFWEGAHWRAAEGGAMFTKDWTPRPAAKFYEDLVLNQWWTRAKLKTAANGQTQTRAFYGTHRITVTKNGQTATQEIRLEPNGPQEFTVKLTNPR